MSITDIKISKTFGNGPKMSLCINDAHLTCNIPNLYKTFGEGYNDPSNDPAYDIDYTKIKKYLGGEIDSIDRIYDNYTSYPDCDFKKEYKNVNDVLKNLNIQNADGIRIITESIEFYRRIHALTGENIKNTEAMGDYEIIVSLIEINGYLQKINLRTINAVESNILKQICAVNIIVNSRLLLLPETIFEYLSYTDSGIFEAATYNFNLTGFTDAVYRECFAHSYLWCLFHKIIGEPKLIIFSNYRLIGDNMNASEGDAIQSFFHLPNFLVAPLKWSKAFYNDKATTMTAFIHELGHNLEHQPNLFSQNIRDKISSFKEVWIKKFTNITSKKLIGMRWDKVVQESFADLVAVKWIEDYVFNPANGFTDDKKYDIIKKSFGWTMKFPKSTIEANHPHHPFRINLLLTSIPIHNFLCGYNGDQNLRKFKSGLNPACYSDRNYDRIDEPYFKKYLKYKNKYLSLKKSI